MLTHEARRLLIQLGFDVLRDLLAEIARPDAIEGEWQVVDDVARPVAQLPASTRQRADVAANEQQE